MRPMNRVSIGWDNGLLHIRRQAILTNAGLLSTGPLGTNFSVILIKIQGDELIHWTWGSINNIWMI